MASKWHLSALCLAMTAGLIGCSGEAESSKPQPQTTTESTPASTDPGAQAYPIDYCIVSGEKLGEMGDPVQVTVEGRTVMLCCEMCKEDLMKDPSTYLAKLDAAAEGASKPESGSGHGDHQH
ncbi:MAG: hypothetical protein R3C45_05480 [Phycisphaerales bacterium]